MKTKQYLQIIACVALASGAVGLNGAGANPWQKLCNAERLASEEACKNDCKTHGNSGLLKDVGSCKSGCYDLSRLWALYCTETHPNASKDSQ